MNFRRCRNTDAWTLLFLIVAGSFLLSCNKGQKEDRTKAEAEKKKDKTEEAVPVEVTSLERGRLESVLRATANLEAEAQVVVPARTSNRVLELLVEEGDDVKAGQILLRLENDAQQTALERAKVQLEKVRREYDRKKSLYEKNLISTQEFNNATSDLEELELTVKDNQRELDYTKVRAPISGTITQRMVNLGDQVNLNQNLFEIIDFNSIVARIFVPEKHLPTLKQSLPARISSAALGEKVYEGEVIRIAPTIDAQTGTVKVTVGIDRVGILRPGLFVDVGLVLEVRDDALLIPKKALVYDDAEMYVFSLKADSRVTRKRVEPRLTDRFYVEPVSGFEVGERIVIAGQAGLKEGALVSLPGQEVPEPEEAEPATAQNAGSN